MAAALDYELSILECPVCYERLKPPIETCENGHGICGNCRKIVQFCGVCRKKFTGAQNTLLNQVIGTILIKCKFSAQGCTKSFSISTIEDHEKICYYRKERCLPCGTEVYLSEMSRHLKGCKKLTAKSEIKFLTYQTITYSTTETETNRYFALYITDTGTFFMERFFRRQEKIFICVQYLGIDQENAGKYKYDIRIDQGLPSPNQSYYSFSGLCVPYFYSKEEVIKQKGVIELNLKSIFLTDDYLKTNKVAAETKVYELS